MGGGGGPPAALGRAASVFGPWFDWETVPVADVMDDYIIGMWMESSTFHD